MRAGTIPKGTRKCRVLGGTRHQGGEKGEGYLRCWVRLSPERHAFAVTAVTGGDIFFKYFDGAGFSPKTASAGPSLVPGRTMCMMLRNERRNSFVF